MSEHEVSTSKYAKMVDEVRAVYKKHGSELFHQADEYGLNEFFVSGGGIEFVFYYDGLSEIRTPDGQITPLGSRGAGNEQAAHDELVDRFGLVLVSDATKNHERWIVYKVTKE